MDRKQVDESYINILRQASGEIWNLFKAYVGIGKKDDKQWDELYEYIQKMYNKYKGTEAEEYVRHYLTMVIEPEIERVSNSRS